MKKVVLLGFLLFAWVEGHSWMQCADYSEENGQFWDTSRCRAYPRDYYTRFQYNNIFGGDVGYDYRPTDAAPCLTSYSATSYQSGYNMASYSPGQRVCLAWPPKNHVAAACDNIYIPDHGTKIYRSPLKADFTAADPTLPQFRQNLVADLGTNSVAGAGVGFQNCPNYCADRDKCLCTGCFNIPSDLAIGKYTFLWEWAFNSATDLYATCFDVNIVANSGNTVTALSKIGPDAFAALSTAATSSTAATTTTTTTTTTKATTSTTTSNTATSATTSATSATSASTSATSATSASSGSAPTTTSTASSGTPPPINYGTCPIGSLRCNCTSGGTCDEGNVCASGICVLMNDVKSIAPKEKSTNTGHIALAVIVTLVGVVAIGAGLVLVARLLPNSAVGSFLHKLIDSPSSSRL